MQSKFGFQAPKNHRIKRFNYVHINGDFHYCESHNFMYDVEEQEKLLYDGKPNYNTDKRYYDGDFNYYRSTYLHFSRSRWPDKYGISLKSAFRLVEFCGNIPVGTVVDFEQDWVYTHKKINPSFRYVVRKENKFDPKYEITKPSFFRNFTRDDKRKTLVDALRENGFLVQVFDENPDYITSMINQASKSVGQPTVPNDIGGEVALAYGFGKKIGFSSHGDAFMGYSNGCDNILFDHYGEFNKWSQCLEIPKTSKVKDIIKKLKA